MNFRLLAAATAIVLVGATMVPAGDKALSSMNQPVFFVGFSPPPLAGPPAASWINGTSKGKMKLLPSCKVSVKLTGTTLPSSDGVPGTGDEVICLVDFNADGPPLFSPVGFVLRGEVNNGKVRIVADLVAEGLPFLCAPAADFSELRATCYEPDGAYAPGLFVPFASDATQGLFGPGYPPRPATGLMATDSVRF